MDKGDLLIMRHGRKWLGVLAGIGLVVPLLHASVFSSRKIDLFTPSTYGRLIYKTIMEINGGKADVSVVACDDGLDTMQGALTAQHDARLRWVSLDTGEGKPGVLVTVVQSPSEKEASQSARARHRIADVPVPSDGIVLGTMRSADTRTTYERLTSRLGRSEVVQFYDQAMIRSGWSKLVAASEEGGFLFYAKGADLCAVLVTIQESDGETGISLLHKQGAVN